MGWIGIPIMSFLYGIDFEPFRGLSFVMIAAGGVTAVIDFLYQAITVLRRQKDVTKLYLLTFAFSIFVPLLLIGFTGLSGAVLSYLIVMCILLSLLVMEYVSIRMNFFKRGEGQPSATTSAAYAADETRAMRSVVSGASFDKRAGGVELDGFDVVPDAIADEPFATQNIPSEDDATLVLNENAAHYSERPSAPTVALRSDAQFTRRLGDATAPSATTRMKTVMPRAGSSSARLSDTRHAAARSMTRMERAHWEEIDRKRAEEDAREMQRMQRDRERKAAQREELVRQAKERKRIEEERNALRGETVDLGGAHARAASGKKARLGSWFRR